MPVVDGTPEELARAEGPINALEAEIKAQAAKIKAQAAEIKALEAENKAHAAKTAGPQAGEAQTIAALASQAGQSCEARSAINDCSDG